MGSSGNLEIGCLETEIIYASLLAQYFVQAIRFPHELVMLSINACDIDRKRLIFRYDRKIPDYFSVAGAP